MRGTKKEKRLRRTSSKESLGGKSLAFVGNPRQLVLYDSQHSPARWRRQETYFCAGDVLTRRGGVKPVGLGDFSLSSRQWKQIISLSAGLSAEPHHAAAPTSLGVTGGGGGITAGPRATGATTSSFPDVHAIEQRQHSGSD